MIIQMGIEATERDVLNVIEKAESKGLKTSKIIGQNIIVIALIGDTSKVSDEDFAEMKYVDRVTRIQEPYKKANRKSHPENTIIDINGIKIGGEDFVIMAGPCSVETPEQITEVARAIKKSGAQILRGGAFKPRTSPYSFQGLEAQGLDLLNIAKKETGLPIVSELMAIDQIPLFLDKVDIIQVGARNMQNFALLKELGKIDKPILLKRGMSATIEEFIMSAEYIMAGGNNKVILCERGIRTFETYTRNTLDLSVVPAIKELTHLPIIIDPSHATGKWWMVESLSKAAVAVGADGLMVEVHNCPEKALSDGPQSLKPEKFDKLVKELRKFTNIVGKKL
ncbi:3-deoxy-D-arabinoheptulosonate-7-phosphate synthase [Hypnocyclicus thermotrophus]|uniref:3-deoxy-D-arabinoheptulosonate-7-phosphate synthase n=1 Tax=Hypnocyclicus thermotrophus TaxID=1627895 RepID=A0AA46DZG0_9FUSO|nr:3-deoxy-7-phosphoheptulonate synthase [Hypnocyclicus thermotrophus]TDT71764.1 3-deoxy-D-arabinoheptulosonate-7-phosphate synthase [Hypnocyclicus thermotrophus]